MPAGRATRGSSRFYLSLEDDLMRIFGSDKIQGLMDRLGMEEGVPIEHGMVTKAIERAQKQVEGQHFSVRKHLLEYDDVMNKQRENVYALRRELLENQIRLDDDEEPIDARAYLMTLAEGMVDDIIDTHCSRELDPEEWDLPAVTQRVADLFALDEETRATFDLGDKSPDEMVDLLWGAAQAAYEMKAQTVDETIMRRVERDVMLQVVDTQWKDHLYGLDHLKEGISLRGYGQRNPLVEYKRESFAMFQGMKERIDEETIRYLWRIPAGRARPGRNGQWRAAPNAGTSVDASLVQRPRRGRAGVRRCGRGRRRRVVLAEAADPARRGSVATMPRW